MEMFWRILEIDDGYLELRPTNLYFRVMTYEFGECILDFERRVLTKAGARQKMEPQVFDLLRYLVENSGRAIAKDEIVAAIWQGRAISDSAITSRIKAARRVIGDDGQSQRFIRTLHKIGYEFAEKVAAGERPEASSALSLPETKFFTDRRGLKIAYSVMGKGPELICPAWWVSNVAGDLDNPSVRSFFSRLSEGFSLVRYDRPGTGMSERVMAQRTLDDDVNLLEDMIAERGERKLLLFVMSGAGPTALAYAARHPECVRRICFFGTFIYGQKLGPPDVQEAIIASIRAHWGLGSRTIADMFLPDASKCDREAFARQQRSDAGSHEAAELLRLTYNADATAYVNRVRAPSMVIHRRGDRCVPVEEGRRLAAELPNARLQLHDGRAHPPWIDGASIAAEANTFLRERKTSLGIMLGSNQFNCRPRHVHTLSYAYQTCDRASSRTPFTTFGATSSVTNAFPMPRAMINLRRPSTTFLS